MLQLENDKSHRGDAALDARPELLPASEMQRARSHREDEAQAEDTALDPRQMQLWQRIDGRAQAPAPAVTAAPQVAAPQHAAPQVDPTAPAATVRTGDQPNEVGNGETMGTATRTAGIAGATMVGATATGPQAGAALTTTAVPRTGASLQATGAAATDTAAALDPMATVDTAKPATTGPVSPTSHATPAGNATAAAHATVDATTATTTPAAATTTTPAAATTTASTAEVAATTATAEVAATTATATAPVGPTVTTANATSNAPTTSTGTITTTAPAVATQAQLAPSATAATHTDATAATHTDATAATHTDATAATHTDATAATHTDATAATADTTLPRALEAHEVQHAELAGAPHTAPAAPALHEAGHAVADHGDHHGDHAALPGVAGHHEAAHAALHPATDAQHVDGAHGAHEALHGHGPVPFAPELAGAPGHGHGDALGQDTQELRELDPRGTAKPDVATQTTAIEQLGHAVDLSPETLAKDHPAGEAGEHQITLPKDARTVEEVDAAANQQRATILANSRAKQDKVHSKLAAGAPHRAKADGQKQIAHQQGQRSAETHKQSFQQAQQRKAVSKDELRAKLTTTATTKKAELTGKLETKKAELESKLRDKLKTLIETQQKENERLGKELDARTVKLQADITKRKEAHDKQIAKERVALDKLDQTEQDKAKAKAKTDADKIKAEAAKQAEATQNNAETRAGEVETKGAAEAAAAVTAGDSKASQATAAAEARAGKLDAEHKDEATAVRAEGTHRAQMARDQAAAKADGIRAKAKADAKALRDKGKADHDKQLADGETRAAQAIKNGDEAAAKIHAQTLASIATMQAKSDAAVKAMAGEVEKMKADVEAKRAEMNNKAGAALAEIKVKTEAEKQKALADMAKESDKTLKEIDAKVTADLAKIDAASDKDLARLSQQIDRDIAQINASVARAEQHIDQAVTRAEQHTQALVAKEQAQIHADTSKIVGQLDHMAMQARQKIASDDKTTKKDIHAAGQQGLTDVAATSTKAQADLDTANQKLVAETTKQGEQNRAEADKLAADSQKAMEDSRKGLDKEINKAWVDDAVKKANEKLDDRGLFNVVTDGEANEAMNILNSLPADQQGEAVKQLDKAAFDNLLGEVPAERREEFKTLVDNTHDPERKLQLWGEQHKSEVANDAKKEHEKTKDDGYWFWRNDDQKRNHRLNERRDEIVKSSNHEVDDEMKFLMAKQAAGTLTEQDVIDLEKRKEHEHQIEMKYNVNLTNKDGTRANGTKIAWNDSELNEVESALAHMPEGHVKDNTLLKEIKRSDQSPDEKDPTKPNIGGQHGGGVISIYDLGVTGLYRHSDDPHELADPSLRGVDGQPLSKTGDPIGRIEETLNHEFGHDIHDQNPDAFNRYQQAAGWQTNVNDAQMTTAGVSAADIAALKAGTKTDIKGSDGKVYKPDPYNSGQILAVDDGAVPEPGTGAQPNSVHNWDTWDYARTNHKDNFAEHYTKAINAPEKLAKDLIDAPATRVTNETTTRDAAQAALDAEKAKSPADPAALAAKQAKVDEANAKVADAVKDQTAQKTEYDIMRNDIFHADKATNDAVKRLEAKGVDPAKIAEFKAKAARAQTPQQVDLIASGY